MAEASFEPQRDTSMNGKFKTTNYGATSTIRLGKLYGGGTKSELYRTLLNFDVSSLAGETIQTARLVREITLLAGVGGHGARVLRCTRPDTWVEAEATWDNYKSGTPWTAGGGDFDAVTPPEVSFSEALETGSHSIFGLTAFVEDALANRSGIVSLLLRLGDESATDGLDQKTHALSKEHPFATGRPNLIVEHGDVAAGPTERRYSDVLPAHGEARPARGASPVSVPAGARVITPRGPAHPARGGDW